MRVLCLGAGTGDTGPALAQELLHLPGINYVAAESVAEARTRLAEGTFDLVLANLAALGNDAGAFADELRQRTPAVPVVALSDPAAIAALMRLWAARATGAGADGDRETVIGPAAEQERYRLLVEHAPYCVHELDLEGRFTAINAAGLAMLGAESENEVIGMSCLDLVSPGDQEQVARLLGNALRGESSQFEFTTTRGSHYFSNFVPLWNAQKRVRALMGITVDITDRRTQEDALRRERDFAATLVSTAPVIILLLNMEGRIEHANPYFEELTGYRLEEIAGKEWFETFLPLRDRDRIRALFRTASGGRPTRGNVNPIVTRSGEEREIEWYDQVMSGPDGTFRAVLAIGQDVTERRRAEEALRASEKRLREAQRVAQLGSWELDLTTDALTWSDEIFRMFEIDREQFGASYEAFLNAIHPDDRAAVDGAYTGSLQTRQPYEIIHRLLMTDGRIKYVHERCETSYAPDGTALRSLGTVQDITQQRLAERHAQETERRYERVVGNMSDGLMIDDVEGRVIFANDRFFEVFSIPRRDPGAIRIADYVAPEWRDRAQEQHDRRIRGEALPAHFEFVGIRGDGSRVWLDAVVTPVVEDGRVIGTQSTMRDISERKLSEMAMQLLSTGTAHLAGDGFFQELALQAARLLGVEIGFVGRLQATDPPRIRTLGLAVDGELMPALEYDLANTPCERSARGESAVFADGVAERFPLDHYLADAGVVSYAAVPLFDGGGHATGHIGVMGRKAFQRPEQMESILRMFAVRAGAEIERQRTETQFKDLFEFSPDGIIIVGANGLIMAANQQICELTGYRGDELVGQSIEALVPDDVGPHHVALRESFVTAGTLRVTGPDRQNLRARRKDGSTFPVEISLSPMEMNEGTVVVATVRDTTERVRAEAERRALEARLRQAQKMEAMGTLAGGIAHDFNNLLAAIMGNAELATMDLDPGHPAAETLDEIKKAGTRARDLVRQILTFSRQQEQPRTTAQLAPVIEEVIRLMRAALPAGVEIVPRLAPRTPAVAADQSQVHQVVMNLCTNAWQALEGKPGRIHVVLEGAWLDSEAARRRGELSPGHYARLSVADTGKGMDAETMERVFDPFFTTKGGGGGTGLGLAVVHNIVRSHGGAIVVRSRPGEGAVFEILLPASPEARESGEANAPGLPHGGGEHILYIDDEAQLVALARRVLEGIGYRVTAFSDAQRALDWLRDSSEGPAALLTDHNMPGISGLDVIAEAVRLHPGLPVALTSGFVTEELQQRAAALGCSEILSKPAGLADLAHCLRRLLNST